MLNNTILKWSDVDFLIERIIDEISWHDFKFDTIVGLGRGGLIPATILSYKLGVYNLQNLGINTRHKDNKTLKQLIKNLSDMGFKSDTEKFAMIQKPTVWGKVLVVDDINDSGDTFKTINYYLENHLKKIKDIRYCALVKRYNSKFNQGFYGNSFHSDNWMVFPWDK